MRALHHGGRLIGVALVVVLVGGATAWGQPGLNLTGRCLPDGRVVVSAGPGVLFTLDLNAHGPNWTNVGQEKATASPTDIVGEGGLNIEGTLPVPNTNGGAVKFSETVWPAEQGFSLAYNLGFTKDMTLNGLQVSMLMPVGGFIGKTLAIQSAGAEVLQVTLPQTWTEQTWQLGDAEGDAILIDTGGAMPIAIRAAEGQRLLLQDLRRWDHDLFELRFTFIFAAAGQPVKADEARNLSLELEFDRQVEFEGI